MNKNQTLPAPPGRSNLKPVLAVLLFFLKLGIVVGIAILAETAAIRNDHTFIGIFVITLFILFMLSAFVSAHLTYAVRRGLIAPRPGSLLEKIVKFWERLVPPYDVRPILDSPTETVTEADMQANWVQEFTPADVDEMLTFILNKKGGGRKSDVPDEKRFRAVRDWILMQMKGTSVRLQDFLDERFGYHSNGEPMVPRDTFYGWYKKFKKMLTEYKSVKQA